MYSLNRFVWIVVLTLCTAAYSDAQRGVPVSSPVRLLALDPDPVLQQLVQSVDSARILVSLNRLEAFQTRHSSTDSVVAAKNWLVTKFQEYGYSDILLHPFTWSGRTLHNIVVTKPGTRFPDKYVLLIGHYDSISETPTTLAPGVNDNGSGIALILEVARILAIHQLDYSVRFVCFSAEEQGLIGSRAYVDNVVVPQNHDVKLVMNVDEIGGYRGYTNTMVKVERDENNNPSGNNAPSAAYTDTLATLTRTYSTLTTTITNAYGSDYMSFEARGYVITGYYEGQTTPHYHHSTDNVANVDPAYLYQITRGALAGMAYFGGIQRKYLTILHNPHGDTQDTSRAIEVDAKILSSAPVQGSDIVFWTSTNPAPITAGMAYLGSSGDSLRYQGFIPKQPYGTSVSYYLRFVNGDTVVATFPADTSSPIVFQVSPDSIPPVLVHTPLSNRSYLDAPYELRATVSDENNVSLAWIEYNVGGGGGHIDTMVQTSATLWRGFITGPFSPGDCIQYAVYARDGSFSGNTIRVPAAGWYEMRVLNSLVFDFESSGSGFSGSGNWEWGTIGTGDIPLPPQGQHVWATNLTGNYSNNLVSDLESPTIDLTNKAEGALTFSHLYRIEPNNDGGNVWISVDSGAFEPVTPLGGYPSGSVTSLGGPGYSANSTGWVEGRFALSSLTNHRIRVRFHFASDWLTNHRGWYVSQMRVDYLDSITVAVRPIDDLLPVQTSLEQCYPNPFNPTTTVKFTLSDEMFVTLKVYDILGREVTTLLTERRQAGSHALVWNASSQGGEVSSGVYFVRMFVTHNGSDGQGPYSVPTLVATQRVVLIK